MNTPEIVEKYLAEYVANEFEKIITSNKEIQGKIHNLVINEINTIIDENLLTEYIWNTNLVGQDDFTAGAKLARLLIDFVVSNSIPEIEKRLKIERGGKK